MAKTLVTGAAGFIGSCLTEALVKAGREVRAFARYNSRNNWGWLEDSPLLGEMEVVAGDIRDFDSVHTAMEGCAEVYHLAALIGIPYSYESPLAYLRTNTEGTYNVLQSARMRSATNVVVTSTSETYGTAQFRPITEEHPAVGQSPYAATKIGADQLALSYQRSFGLPVKIARPFNTFGPRQSARAVIPTVAVQALSGARSIKLGNLAPTRDLTYVLDTVEGIKCIGECEALVGQAVNICTNAEISVGELARKIVELCDAEVELVEDVERVRPEQSEVERLRGDNTKLMEHTDWKPCHTLEEGLRLTIDWLRDHLDLYKAELYTR